MQGFKPHHHRTLPIRWLLLHTWSCRGQKNLSLQWQETCWNWSSLETVGFLVLHTVPCSCPLQTAGPGDPQLNQSPFPHSFCSWAPGTTLCSPPASDCPMGEPGCVQGSATSPACMPRVRVSCLSFAAHLPAGEPLQACHRHSPSPQSQNLLLKCPGTTQMVTATLPELLVNQAKPHTRSYGNLGMAVIDFSSTASETYFSITERKAKTEFS